VEARGHLTAIFRFGEMRLKTTKPYWTGLGITSLSNVAQKPAETQSSKPFAEHGCDKARIGDHSFEAHAVPTLVHYACFACRKVFKKPWAEQTEMDYPCPDCAQRLSMMGIAFRAPRRADLSQWRKVEKLVRAGILFYRNDGPRPRRLNEAPAFLQEAALAKQSPGERVLGRISQSAQRTSRRSQGRLKRLNTEGKPEFELAGRELSAWMRVLVHDGKEWLEGTFRITGGRGQSG